MTIDKITSHPDLKTILMVEETIQKMDYPEKTELWKALPKKVMYQTYCLIIDYLEQSGKILIDKDGRIVWTWNPKMVKKIIASGSKTEMKVFVTADNHFCHKNIIKYCKRPFSSVEEMNTYMINRWNKSVSKNDLVFHLGDFALTSRKNLYDIRQKLNGIIIIIPGNHDRRRVLKQSDFIVSTTDRIKIKNIVLSHRPLDIIDDETINVHGHIHEKQTSGRRINASVDVTNFEPVLIEKYFREATLLLKKRKILMQSYKTLNVFQCIFLSDFTKIKL